MSKSGDRNRELTLLFTCVGRRVELLQAFRAAARRLGISLRLVATDQSATAPGMHCVDVPIIVPPIENDGYLPAVCDAIQKYGVNALIPTIDNDLMLLSQNRARLSDLGCVPLVADPAAIEATRDKLKTFELLKSAGVDTPETWPAEEVLGRSSHTFPYFIKPRFGFAALWTRKVADLVDLEFYCKRIDQPIVQEFVAGIEHTLDAYTGLTGRTRCVVPRRRLMIRGGEVSRAVIVKNDAMMKTATRVVEALGPSVRGLVTLQCFLMPDGNMRFIEINTRFGGGAPLSIAAGADFPGWLMLELLGEEPAITFDGFEDHLGMLRYDWSAFVRFDSNMQPQSKPPLRPWPLFE